MNVNKRLLKELRNLYIEQESKQFLENDFLVFFDESNLKIVHAILKAPYDSVYRHKFIRLDIKIPDDYPYSPPDVTFINYDGVRIHPNMYEDGKCCSTILNTWGDNVLEKWTSSMGIETILITFHSFLDNNPYTYEPGGADDPSYTVYVLYQSWISCLIRYLQNERIEMFKQFMHNYLLVNIGGIFTDLYILAQQYTLERYYTRCFEIDHYIINYEQIITILQNFYNYMEYKEIKGNELDFKSFIETSYRCNICFDTTDGNGEITTTVCNHTFHAECLKNHVEKNHKLCPMCRHDINTDDDQKIWMINPLTKRRIKIGGRTHTYLIENNLIEN